ncbi:MAG: sugar phosphate isomerase/epimerase [Sphingobacteriales bacterium]|nr:sugar phosphate isomerase/epimerase [Sphingobacteriales bacterium]
MPQSRRQFIRNSSLLTASIMLNPSLKGMKNKKLTGIQLYSVRDDMKKDPLGTLKQIAAMGYKHVEHANYVDRKFYGYSASEFKKVLSDMGMAMPSGHTVMRPDHWDAAKKDFSDSWKYTVEDAAIAGQQYVISPWLDESLRKTYDDALRYMEVFNKSGELCKKSGMKFGYHNHDFEFSVKLNDKALYDIILNNTDPNLVAQQLDTGNLFNGGVTALEIVNKFPGRFELMHVKDEIASADHKEKYESTILGKGIAEVKKVIDIGAASGGTTHFIIEQEAYQGKSPIDCAKEDLKVMKEWGY